MGDRTVSAAEFKAKCLRLMDEVAETRQPVVITKRGRPVARLEPVREERPFFGFAASYGRIVDPNDDLNSAFDEEDLRAMDESIERLARQIEGKE